MWSLPTFQSDWDRHAGAGLLLLLAGGLAGRWAFEKLGPSKKPATQLRLRPQGTLPIFYNTLHAMKHSLRWADWITEQVESFKGQAFWLRILGTPDMLVLTTAEQFEDVLKTHFDVFEKGPYIIDIFEGLFGAGIFAADGKQWTHQRKTASNLFSLRALRESMTESIQKHALVLNGVLDRTAALKSSVDVFKLLNRFTMDTFAEIGFGIELGTLESTEDHPFQVAFDSAQHILVLRILRPSWFWKTQRYLNMGVEKEFRQHLRVIDDTVFTIIARTLENRAASQSQSQSSQQHGTRKDIVSLFLDNVSADADEDKTQAAEAFDPVFLRDIVLNFLIAGRDTTAQMLSWFFYSLSQHPHVEQKIRDELAHKLLNLNQGKGKVATTPPSMEQTGELVYLEAALREAMRLHPAVPRNRRQANRDVTLRDGTFIRKGEAVSISSYVLGRMTHVWGDDAKEYNPERWIDHQSGKLIQVSPFQFPAFHAGPRMCLGMSLAMVEMKIVAAMVLSKFHLELVPGQTITAGLSLTLPIKGALMMNVLPVVG